MCCCRSHEILGLNLPNIFSEDQDESRRDQEKLDLVELLEAVTYLVCQDNHVVPDTFYKVTETVSKVQLTELNTCLRSGLVEVSSRS